jgi:hypothetical protein
LIAYCGLDCQTCPIYLATRQADKQMQVNMRVEIARLCKQQYGMDLTLEDIHDCDGCRTEAGRLFSQCRTCPIRICAREKHLENCAWCTEYACAKLETFFRTDPMARTRLEAIRAATGNQ